MARPRTGKPPKKNLMLTVSETTRENLSFLSTYHGESISALVAHWAEKGAKAIRLHIEQQESESVRKARQKSAEAAYQNLNISVNEQTRDELKIVSSYACASISAIVSAWAAKESSEIRADMVSQQFHTNNKEE